MERTRRTRRARTDEHWTGAARQADHLRHPHAGRRRASTWRRRFRSPFSRSGLPAHRRRRRQRRRADRPDAGDRHAADRRSAEHRPGPRARAVDHQPRDGGDRPVLLVESRHVPDAGRVSTPRWRACRRRLPPTAKVTANRLTFAAFPIMGYSLTSDTVPQTRLWEIATYDLKPRLNRMTGVSTIVVQGGQEPEFEVRPDPAKLAADRDHHSDAARCDRPQQSDRLTGPVREQPPAGAEPGERPGAHARRTSPTSSSRRRRSARRSASATWPTSRPSVKPVYTIVTANTKPAVLLNVFRQPDSNTVAVAERGPRGDRRRSGASCRRASSCSRSTTSRKSSTTRSRACATR